jgi:SAM-dependent methyltransferase
MTRGEDRGLSWQIGVWNDMADVYVREIDRRFAPIIDRLLTRAELQPGERILDVGTGTGSVALASAPRVAPDGHVLGVDISAEMLALACARASSVALTNLSFADGRAEAIPAERSSQDTVLASLSLMYVIDRAAAAREIARVLKPGGPSRRRGLGGAGARRHRQAAADGGQLRAQATRGGRGAGRHGRPQPVPRPARGRRR